MARVSRTALVPDPVRLARYEKSPELGPRILFFSGGTALNGLARQLTRYTHNSIHIVTSFDSGGSSAKLREAFRMPAVGDLRSRIMALADRTVKGHPEIVRLFSYRLPADSDASHLFDRLQQMVAGRDALVADIPWPMRDIIRTHLRVFAEQAPRSFDLRGASVGNLILTGGYLANTREIDPVIFLFSKLVEARGTVVPVSARFLELGAELADGQILVGQHRLTGKETAPIRSPIRRIFLCEPNGAAATIEVSEDVRGLIRGADLICFAMGSFYSSILVNLLPVGVVEAIRESGCPRVYVPNSGVDPEQFGMTTGDCVQRLIESLSAREAASTMSEEKLNLVVLDSAAAGDILSDVRETCGVPILRTPLIGSKGGESNDPQLLSAVLVSLV